MFIVVVVVVRVVGVFVLVFVNYKSVCFFFVLFKEDFRVYWSSIVFVDVCEIWFWSWFCRFGTVFEVAIYDGFRISYYVSL